MYYGGQAVTVSRKLLCEYSQNVLYHYILFTLWYVYVAGTIISFVGLVVYICNLSAHMCDWMKTDYPGLLYDDFRKYQYLIIMQDKDKKKAEAIINERKAEYDRIKLNKNQTLV